MPLATLRSGKREEPDVGIAVVPLVEAFEILNGLLMGAWKVDDHRTVAAEIKGAVVGAEAWVVVCTGAVGGVVCVTDGFDGTPFALLIVNDEEMLMVGRVVSGEGTTAAEDEEGLVGCDFGIDVFDAAVAEGQRFSGKECAVAIDGAEEAQLFAVDRGGEIDAAIGSDAGTKDLIEAVDC